MTPRHTTPAPVAHGGVRAPAHGRGRGRTAAEQTAGPPWPERMTASAEDGYRARRRTPRSLEKRASHETQHQSGRRGCPPRGHRRETSLRSDERSRSPESVFTIPGSGVQLPRNEQFMANVDNVSPLSLVRRGPVSLSEFEG